MNSEKPGKKIVSVRYRTCAHSALVAGLSLVTALSLLAGCSATSASTSSVFSST